MTEQEVKDEFDEGVLKLKRDLKKRMATIRKQAALDTAEAFYTYDVGKAALWQARQKKLAELDKEE